MMDKRYQVSVSSTYEDLQEERQEVITVFVLRQEQDQPYMELL